MQYIDILKNQDIVREVVHNANQISNYDFPYQFNSSMIVPHPQKRKHNALKIVMNNTDKFGKSGEKFNIYIDDYEIIKVSTLIKDFPIHECEESAFEENYYSALLIAFMKKMHEIHGDNYVNSAIKQRQKNLRLYITANIEAMKKRDEVLESFQGFSEEQSIQQKNFAKTLNEHNELIDTIRQAISNQVSIISHLENIKDKTTINQAELL